MANEIKGNIGTIYFLKSGQVKDPSNLSSFHPLSNVNLLRIHIEDGGTGENSYTYITYKSANTRIPASHKFPIYLRGLVNHTISGENAPRTFTQYLATIPDLVARYNINSKEPMDVSVTVVQESGVNFIGTFATLTLLNAYATPEEDNIAYVTDNQDYGYYEYDGDSWQEMSAFDIQRQIRRKQYNLGYITLQGGFNLDLPITTLEDAQYKIIWQELEDINSRFFGLESTVEGFELDIAGKLSNVVFEDTGSVQFTQSREDDVITVEANVSDSYVKSKAREEVGQDITDLQNNKATKMSIPQGSIPYRNGFGLGEPNTHLPVNSSQTPTTVALRKATGAVATADPSDNEDAVNLETLNTKLAEKAKKPTHFEDENIETIYVVKDDGEETRAKGSKNIINNAYVKRDNSGKVLVEDGASGKEAINYSQFEPLASGKEDKSNKATDFSVIDNNKYPTTQATESEIIAKITAHNTDFEAHADIRNLISALAGVFIYRGNIDEDTNTISGDKSLLTARIYTLLERTSQIGDVLVDNEKNEWYYNGTTWDNYGQFIIGLATAENDGLMSKELFTKLTNLYDKSQLDIAFNNKVTKNSLISPSTKPKITYDSKGLVTGGSDLVKGDIPDIDATQVIYDNAESELEATKVQGAIDEIVDIVDEKVDKVQNMGLSKNDYDDTEKGKVALLKNDGDGTKYLADDGEYKEVTSGESNIQADWEQTDSGADDYIKNKPPIPTIPNVEINNGSAESGKFISQIVIDETNKHKLLVTKQDLPSLSGLATEEYVDNKVSSVYKPSGNLTSAQIVSGLLIKANLGNVYNVSEQFTTTSDFVEGSGKTYQLGTNIVIVDSGSEVYKFDVLGGFIDTSAFLTSIPQATSSVLGGVKGEAKTVSETVEVKIDGSTAKMYVPTYPTIPTISTNIENDKNDNTKTASPKAVYDYIASAITEALGDDY